MEHHHGHASTHYLMWKLQSEFPASFWPPPFFQESLVWPPRSYPCSFCRREFRSAQALGGHMNVHRHDRAKLKQPPQPQPPKINCGGSGGGQDSGRDINCGDVVCKSHKLCSSEEIDLELRLGAPALKLGHIS